jgi:hypothetical protein
MSEIQAIIRQITASVTFLPMLEQACSFDLLVYTEKDALVPILWEESDPRYISNSTDVRLRSFTTKVCSCWKLLFSFLNHYVNTTPPAFSRPPPTLPTHLVPSHFVGAQGRLDGFLQELCRR